MKKQLFHFFIALFVGLAVYLLPHSKEISEQGWQLFSIFVATIMGIILKPFPMGAITLFALTTALMTRSLTLEEALSGFQNEIVWLVFLAFLIAHGFIKTGLAARISYYFIALLGKHTLGLSYGLLASDFFLAPAIPSLTARSGGVIFPIAEGLAKSFGSEPEHKTQRKIGSFLLKTTYQGSIITSSLFLTAMAANPMIAKMAEEAGYTLTWGMWALGALVPGLLNLILLPLLIYKIYPPEIKDTAHAKEIARKKLKEMGKPTLNEMTMFLVFIILLFLWIGGPFIGMRATAATFLGLSLLLFFKVLDWKEVIGESKAWDTFIWFAIIIVLAGALSKHGITAWFSKEIVQYVGGLHWAVGFLLLYLIYFYSHYFFASATAHIGAMFPAFILVAIGIGTPPYLAILSLAYASNLFSGLTHYGAGHAPLYYSSGYIDLKNWWRIGFLVSLLNIALWLGLGSLWWKLLNLW